MPSSHAWVDESIYVGPPVGYYVLAAAVATLPCEEIRDDLRRLLLKNQRRLHWRDESARRQRRIADAVGSADVTAIVVVGAPLSPRRQERARRLCMERLLHELERLAVTQVWLEQRTSSLNARDMQMVIALRRSRTISAGLRVDFAQPVQEPMLWLPDAVAGIVRARRLDTSRATTTNLDRILTEITIELR